MDKKREILLFGGGVFKPVNLETQLWIDEGLQQGAVLPSRSHLKLVDNYITSQKNDGAWAQRKADYFLANNGSEIMATINLRDPSLYQITNVGAPWVKGVGFVGDGIGYLNTNLSTVSLHGNHSVDWYSPDYGLFEDNSQKYYWGVLNSSKRFGCHRNVDTQIALNNFTYGSVQTSKESSTNKVVSNVRNQIEFPDRYRAYIDGIGGSSTVDPELAFVDYPIFILTSNNNGVATAPVKATMSWFGVGGGIEADVIKTAINIKNLMNNIF